MYMYVSLDYVSLSGEFSHDFVKMHFGIYTVKYYLCVYMHKVRSYTVAGF